MRVKIEPIAEDELRRMYLDDRMAMQEIGKEFGVSQSTILKWMRLYDIPRRTISGPKKYCYKFSSRFREAVRERDDYTCQNCGHEQKLDEEKLAVHHIHYDAENCHPDVISLCKSCHMSSNGNRDAWETHYWCILAEKGLLEWEPPWSEERDENDT